MYQKGGYRLGDSWYQVEADAVHLFYLMCPDHIERHTRWNIGHAVSRDLVNWEEAGEILQSIPGDARLGCLSTGSVVKWQDRYLMALVGNHNSADPVTTLLESKDLYQWSVMAGGGFGIDGRVYTRRGSAVFKNPRWRDPYLWVEGAWLYCLVTAAVQDRPTDADGVVGVVRTRDLTGWEYLPPLDLPALGTDLECPKLYRINGRYHLLVSLFNVLQAPGFAALQPEGLNSSTTFSLVADRCEGPYRFAGNGRVLAADAPGFPYACEAVNWRGEWYLLGTCWSDRQGDRIGDPIPLEANASGLRMR